MKNRKILKKIEEMDEKVTNEISTFLKNYVNTKEIDTEIKNDIIKIQIDILKDFLKSYKHEIDHSGDPYWDCSGVLKEQGYNSLDDIKSFGDLSEKYTGESIATFVSGCGLSYKTYEQELNDNIEFYLFDKYKEIMNIFLKLNPHLNPKVYEDFDCGDDVYEKLYYFIESIKELDFIIEIIMIEDKKVSDDSFYRYLYNRQIKFGNVPLEILNVMPPQGVIESYEYCCNCKRRFFSVKYREIMQRICDSPDELYLYLHSIPRQHFCKEER